MKRVIIIGITVLAALALSSCLTLTGLFPFVPSPMNEDSSMLVVEIGTGTPDRSSWVINANYSGWAPIVLDSMGNEVRFINNEAVSNLDNLYYAPNLEPGSYTFIGFMHVYSDYSLYDSGETITSYGPYEKYPHQIRQIFELPEPIVIDLAPATMDSLGRYLVEFAQKRGSSDDRWKVLEETFRYTYLFPDDRRALQVMKNWATPEWLEWNERNPEEAAD